MGIRKNRGGFSRLSFIFIFFILVFATCKEEENLSPEQKSISQGKGLYLANCSACHNQNPAVDGTVGPAIQGSNFELLKARIVEGTYPPGYTPKRKSRIMTKLPLTDVQIRNIEAFLNTLR
ncbi:c-type cytochrome [Leptospira borgpetersenii]|uniref:c-type cytochrome n=1 Tax=Leptospira borgpetersenii TaxID=174 RepID=UPI000774245D|nr:cytochrome c [Leptospira borgpetersenii]MBE8400252.1 cytochrome c [Leptospira borgpetersenii serovar Tarassovi]MBE8403654.1 cytochrome c [Leptospira borgpetersenii serovar Tarassovi]MBE8406870.1 cytochrome c [Leptospira borgpetersenii serovar Tarassovi]MBE8413040.1 cytochrome c [Leptospira borgpetersenii serovar Tarassovi]MBE8415819.1 cytochrome c [Leptospira borgpetersenii serovar Tarassovi]